MNSNHPLYDLILKRRSVRKFLQDPIPQEALIRMVNAGRLAPSAANLQPLEFVIVSSPELVRKVFPLLSFAAYLGPEGCPPSGKEPTAYVVILINKKIANQDHPRDVGATSENIILTALEQGIGSCWLRTVVREPLKKLLNLPDHLIIDSVIALGKSAEEHDCFDLSSPNDSIRYFRDEKSIHHVPKRRLQDILHLEGYGKRLE